MNKIIKKSLARLTLKTFAVLEPLIYKYPVLRKILKQILKLIPALKGFLGSSQTEIYGQLESKRDKRLLLVDATHMSKTQLHTGIQRVVRALLNELGQIYPAYLEVEPVILSCRDGFWHFEYLNINKKYGPNEIVVPKKGDIFLGLDLNTQVIMAVETGLFSDWKKRGAKTVFTVHDILPINYPHWWPAGSNEFHEKWLRAVLSVSDMIISVSKATSASVQLWAYQHEVDTTKVLFEWFHLGADIASSSPSFGLPVSSISLLDKLYMEPTFLVVGTLEPRKGHLQCLSAFELLWKKGREINLVFVGKEGWMVDELMTKIHTHPEIRHRFFWLDGISDEYLEKVYNSATCLIACSEGEGFGLPLIEAAKLELPIIARDIPVFREVAGKYACYFDGQRAETLAKKIEKWLEEYTQSKHIASSNMPWQTWKQSAERLKQILDIYTEQD